MNKNKQVPNPGSDKAIKKGCKCAVLDNCHGKGFPYDGTYPCFWVASDCPLHTIKKPSKE